MSRKFEVRTENRVDGTPAQAWDAVVNGNSGWLWPMEVEPKLGGAGPFGSEVTAWEPPNHFANHVDGPDGFFNTLDYQIEAAADGGAWIRYMHAGVFLQEMDDTEWGNQYDGVRLHTDFYQHTLGQYVKHFAGQQAAFADIQGPAESQSATGFQLLKSVIGADASVDTEVSFTVPGIGEIRGVLDYATEHFAGVRTSSAMYRFFGRNAFGQVVGMTVHEFEPGAATNEAAWQSWLDGLY